MNGHLDKIYPLKLEEKGFLTSYFGGFPQTHPGLNWTKNSFWVGNMDHTYAIGYYPSDFKLAVYLQNRFSSEIEDVYFPFPEVFNVVIGEERNSIGTIILQFKLKR